MTKCYVHEDVRRIYCEDRVIVLNNVEWFDKSGEWLRVFSDAGLMIFNPDKIVYIHIEKNKDEKKTPY